MRNYYLIAGAISIACASPSLGINLYAHLEGKSTWVMVFAVVFVAFFAPLAILVTGEAARQRAWGAFIVGWMVSTVTISLNVYFAVIGIAQMRAESVEGRQAQIDLAGNDSERRGDIRGRIKALKDRIGDRSAADFESEIRKIEAGKSFRITSGCKKYLGPQTRETCSSYQELSAGLKNATELERLRRMDDEFWTTGTSTEPVAKLTVADPQVENFAALIGMVFSLDNINKSFIAAGMTAVPAIGLEIIADMGPILLMWFFWHRAAKLPGRIESCPAHPAILPENPAQTAESGDSHPAILPNHPAMMLAPPRPSGTRQRVLPGISEWAARQLSQAAGECLTIEELYKDYVNWARQKKIEVATKPTFGAIMNSLGYERESGGARRFRGIGIKNQLRVVA